MSQQKKSECERKNNRYWERKQNHEWDRKKNREWERKKDLEWKRKKNRECKRKKNREWEHRKNMRMRTQRPHWAYGIKWPTGPRALAWGRWHSPKRSWDRAKREPREFKTCSWGCAKTMLIQRNEHYGDHSADPGIPLHNRHMGLSLCTVASRLGSSTPPWNDPDKE